MTEDCPVWVCLSWINIEIRIQKKKNEKRLPFKTVYDGEKKRLETKRLLLAIVFV